MRTIAQVDLSLLFLRDLLRITRSERERSKLKVRIDERLDERLQITQADELDRTFAGV